MCLGQFYLEMDLETASEMASLPWYQNKRKENAARIIKVSTRGPEVPEVICAQKNTTTSCLVIIQSIQGGCSTCSPKTIP